MGYDPLYGPYSHAPPSNNLNLEMHQNGRSVHWPNKYINNDNFINIFFFYDLTILKLLYHIKTLS